MSESELTNSSLFPSSDVPIVNSLLDQEIVGFEDRYGNTVDRRRALHVINGEHYSGAERVQDLLASCLPEFGYEVGFACLKPGLFSEMRKYQAAPVYNTTMRSRADLRAIASLAQVVRDENYEIIHAHTPRSAMVAKLLSVRTGLPLVYHVHSPAANDSTRVWQNRINAWIEKLSLVGVAKIIAVSQSLQRSTVADGYAPSLVSVVPNGVPIRDVIPNRTAPSGRWTLGAVALFRPRKGTEVLLRAMAELVQDGVDVHLRAVGGFEGESYRDSLLKLTGELGLNDRVQWLGFQQNVNEQLNQMDLFVLPSLFGEGLPMVVLESMASGVPVIGTDVEGVPEAIRHGVDGLIAKPNDPSSLANAIRQVVTKQVDWNALRTNALARQRDSFSDRSMAQRVAAVYNQVLTPSQTTPEKAEQTAPAVPMQSVEFPAHFLIRRAFSK